MSTRTAVKARTLTTIAMLSAIAVVLQFLNFPIPIMPSFIKLDFAELPGLIGAFTLGPLSGVIICFIKNLVLLAQSSTMGVGELSNFLLGTALVLPAGLIYKYRKNLSGAIIGCAVGLLFMAIGSWFSNYFLIYPFYISVMGMPKEAILGMYQAINPAVENLEQALLWFNVPFTFCTGLISAIITLLIYKRLTPIICGKHSA